MFSINAGHQGVRAILCMALVCLTAVCATAQTSSGAYQFHDDRQTPAAEADLTIRWTDPPGDRERQIVTLTQCMNGRCGEVQVAGLTISSRPGGGVRKEFEVCSDVNVWSQRCDVYDCYEDNVGMMSVCNFKSSYNKSCYSETCTSLRTDPMRIQVASNFRRGGRDVPAVAADAARRG
jgi:hypothetical protein